uniref:Membrane spanning 4-domains A13 n=1 Tax=Propithecus coquereli TaxID=379532 RepID=A0A2K6GEC3_PROCO
MIGVFEVFMWYLLMVLYMGQIKGVFGTYEPITYKAGCALWGIFSQRREDTITSVADEVMSNF